MLKRTSVETIKWEKFALTIVAVLLLPSFIGLPFFIITILNKKHATKTDYYAFGACIALYFAAINATKQVDGDQVNYYFAYMNVPHLGFIGSLKNIYGFAIAKHGAEGAANISGEFMNGVYNYVGYYITFGYYPLFASLLTFVNYYLLFLGLYKYCQTLKKPHIPFVCGILIISFFYLYFCFTLQIQKQFLAQSIMMYVMGEYSLQKRMSYKLWGIVVISVFTHASMLLFVPFFCIKQLREPLGKWGIFLIVIMVFVLITQAPTIVGKTLGDSTSNALSYGAQRFGNSIGQTDHEGDQSLDIRKLLIIALPMCWILVRKLWTKHKKKSGINNVFILNVLLLLILTIACMYNQPLARYRYFMMLYAFMPFVYPFFVDKPKERNIILLGISCIMIIWFYFQFEHIVWKYAPETDIVICPPAYLIFGGYKII